MRVYKLVSRKDDLADALCQGQAGLKEKKFRSKGKQDKRVQHR